MSEDPVVYQTNQVRTDKRNRIKQHANRVIWVTFQREGIHKYPAAATDPNLADVSFSGWPDQDSSQSSQRRRLARP